MEVLHDVDLEDGELSDSSDEVYVPLARPSTLTGPPAVASSNSPIMAAAAAGKPHMDRMEQAVDELVEEEEVTQSDSSSSSSDSSSDNCLKAKAKGDKSERKKKKKVHRTVMVRVQPAAQQQDTTEQKRSARFKKYNIWTEALQEEALTETMRGCDVTRPSRNDRSVENYDFTILQRLKTKNSLKRRLSNSADEQSDSEMLPAAKRGRRSSHGSGKKRFSSRGSNQRGSSGSRSSSENSYEPRHIMDLNEVDGREPMDVAREIANKLYEEKDELMMRVVEVLGVDLAAELYKETQRIEADGGMQIHSGNRRRTPGGVFLFLLKHHDTITGDEMKSIFAEDRQQDHKMRKQIKAISRDRKVEELKKRLSETGKEMPALSTRKEHFLLGSDLSVENQSGNLSNPPPSPVGQDQSPDYKTHAINHVAGDETKDAASTSSHFSASNSEQAKDLVSYDDDFLDVNCGDMDLF